MSNNSYPSLLAKLLQVNMHGGIKLGLENCEKMNRLLNHPAQAYPSIHIAGTNGKGSVATKIAAALQAAGYKVGLYTSPHISCFRERIKIDGKLVSESSVKRLLTKLFKLIENEQIPATFFEITTLMALVFFAEEKVDYAVIETGLGGRYDATNIVKTKLAVITSISLEHTEYLGDTIDKIAVEKAGIIKPNTPVVLGPRLPTKIFEGVAKIINSPIIYTAGSFDSYCKENEAIAKNALLELGIPEKSINIGLSALPHCRMEEVNLNTVPNLPNTPPKAIILDVAHNPDGIERLLASLKLRFPEYHNKFRFVLGISKSKDVKGCLGLIIKAASHIHLVEATNGRAASNNFLAEQLKELGCDNSLASLEKTTSVGVSNAIQEAGTKGEIVVICGTFFIMGEARHTLGINEPQDPNDLNER